MNEDDLYMTNNIHANEFTESSICDVINDTYAFYFQDNMNFATFPSNNKRIFLATEFSIKSNGHLYDRVKLQHGIVHSHNRHVVTLVLMLSKDTSQTFVEILQVLGGQSDSIYLIAPCKELYNKLTFVLAQLHCPFIVEHIVFKKEKNEPVLLIVFDDIKSCKFYKGDLLDIFIEITFTSYEQN